MVKRRRARELALQALFYMDMSPDTAEEKFVLYCKDFTPPVKASPFFSELVNGVSDKQSELDGVIEKFSSNWKVSRMACVDRNVIRVAVYEMLFCDDIPFKVSINEAIDIGKKFGTEESGAFINGILDSVRKAIESNKIDIKSK
ncbi:MAG: transcription antitermination factor NusB [Desulfobacterales bacterium]|nr:transcription antitermination factor NusB [Desulfobacterales bacterium]